MAVGHAEDPPTEALDAVPGWPPHDRWPPDPPLHPLVAAARRFSREVLEPGAALVEDRGVQRSTLDQMVALGLLGGGLAATPATAAREITETLAGSSGSTWLVAAQHATPHRLVSTSDNEAVRDRWQAGLAAGSQLAGLVTAHLRRRKPSIVATRTEGGWVLEGIADWCTGWGLIDVVLIGAVTSDANHVFAMIPTGKEDRPAGLGASEPLRLSAMRGSRTSRLFFSQVPVKDEDVVLVQPRQDWLEADALVGAGPKPAAIGLLRRCLAALSDLAARRKDEATVEVAHALGEAAVAARRRAYRVVDDPATDARERAAARAEVLELLVRSSSALIAARGGAAMADQDPAARWAREALFHLVQAQTADGRAATLGRWANVTR